MSNQAFLLFSNPCMMKRSTIFLLFSQLLLPTISIFTYSFYFTQKILSIFMLIMLKYTQSIYSQNLFSILFDLYNNMINLDSDNILQGQPSIKNAHTATHMRMLHNDLVFVCLQQSIFIYSLKRVANQRAPLVNIIRLKQIFSKCEEEFYQDFITKIFRNAQKDDDFSTQIFSREGDTRSNVLLKVEAIRERISFFNNSTIRVTKFQFNSKGQALILLADGRAIVLQRRKWQINEQNIIFLNEISREKIKTCCFVDNDALFLVTAERIIMIADLNQSEKIISTRYTIPYVNQIYGESSEKEKIKLFLINTKQVHIVEFKKKILSSKSIKFDYFISQSFFFRQGLFILSKNQLYKIEHNSLQKNLTKRYQQPTQLIYLDQFGNGITKPISNLKQSLWLVDKTSNGVFVGLTIRRNGNYKQGRLIIIQPNLQYYLKCLAYNISSKKTIDIGDSIFVIMDKQKKQFLEQINQKCKNGQFAIQGRTFSEGECLILRINIAHAFQGKQSTKQNILQKILRNKFQQKMQHTSGNGKQYLRLCCFSGKILKNQQLMHCIRCNLYGIYEAGQRCTGCWGVMEKYQ